VDGSLLPPERPGQAERQLSRRLFLPDFAKMSLPELKNIVSKARKPPYVSFKPETCAELYEMNMLVIFLSRGPEEGLDNRLAQAASCWRTRFVPKGVILIYSDWEKLSTQLWYSGGGTWSTRLWPVTQRTGAGGAKYYVLNDIPDAAPMECRPTRSFAEVKIVRTQFPCPLLWFIANGYLPSCAVLHEDCLQMATPGVEEETMEVLPWVAHTGWRGVHADDMTLLCSLELRIADKTDGRSKAEVLLRATEAVLGLPTNEAALILQSALDEPELDSDLVQTLQSEAAQDVIGKDDQKRVGKMVETMEGEEGERRHLMKVIRRNSGGGGLGAAASGSQPTFVGDKFM
jgi:hypothetical protein